jgi:hypothetical protein
MLKRKAMAVALATSFGVPCAHAQTAADLDKIRQEMKALKDNYEARIKALEAQLDQAEAASKKAEAAAAQAEMAARQAEAAATNAGDSSARAESATAGASLGQQAPQQKENAFNPAISLILNGTWGRYSNDPTTQITGFAPSGGEVSPPRGLSLGESELFMSANIDPYFRGALLAALTPENTIAIEEAYFETLALGRGFTIKGGRFFSGIGYMNSVHAHAWDFVNPSLVQSAFLGSNYGDDGLQLRWVAPLPVFLQLGAEIGRGREFPPSGEVERSTNGKQAQAFFAKVGGDIGASGSYQAGASYLQMNTAPSGAAFLDYNDFTGLQNIFVGQEKVTGLDFVYKWAPEGNPTYRNFKFVTEVFQRKYNGNFTYDTAGIASTDPMNAKQSGWYAQAIYQFIPYWRVGARYDQLNKGNVNLNANAANLTPPEFNATRYTAMVDWSPSEFSRIRLQYSRDLSQQNITTGETITDNQVFLQYIFSLGAHGAHKF